MASSPYSAEECPMARVVGPVTGQRLGIRMPQRAATRQGWLGAAGFLVRRLEEPVPPPEAIEERPRDFMNEYDRVPLFLILEAVRSPGGRA